MHALLSRPHEGEIVHMKDSGKEQKNTYYVYVFRSVGQVGLSLAISYCLWEKKAV